MLKISLRCADKVLVKKKASPEFKRVSALQLGTSLRSNSGRGFSKNGLLFASPKRRPYGKIFLFTIMLCIAVLSFWKEGQKKVSELASSAVKKMRGLASESGSESNR